MDSITHNNITEKDKLIYNVFNNNSSLYRSALHVTVRIKISARKASLINILISATFTTHLEQYFNVLQNKLCENVGSTKINISLLS